MLDSVDIEGLRGVGNVELRFDPNHRVRVLFGVNGVGKTKTLEAIYLGLLFSQQDFAVAARHTLIHDTAWEPAKKVVIDEEVCLDINKSSSGLPILGNFFAEAANHSACIVLIGAGGRSSVAAEPADVGRLGKFDDRRKAHFDRLAKEITSGNLRTSGMNADVRAWFVQRAQSVNPYQVEKDNLQGEINAVLQLIHEVDPRVDAGKLQIDGAQRVFLGVDGRMLELGELSSGFASVVKLFQAIISAYSNFTNSRNLRNLPGVVLIDEIESHLHVSWQTIIVKKLKDLFPKSIFVIATHSPLVLTQLEQGEAYLLQRDEGDGVVKVAEISSPNMKAFADVLEETFGVDLNALKRASLASTDQGKAKAALLKLIKSDSQS